MTAITVSPATAAVQAADRKAAAPKRKSIFARAWAAFIQSRMRQAEREIALHQHLLPTQFQLAGERLSRSEKDLPFAQAE